MRVIIAALMASAVAFGAHAQTSEDAGDAAPGSIAIGILEHAEATDLFEVLPSEQVKVRHIGSGLVCTFDPNQRARVVLFEGAPRGEDVGCDSDVDSAAVTLYATRYPDPTTLRDQLDGAIAAINRRFPQVQSYDPGFEMTTEGAPDSLSAHFAIQSQDRRRMYSRVSVAMHNGWVIKLRFTAPADSDEDLSTQAMMASAIWALTLTEFIPAPSEGQ